MHVCKKTLIIFDFVVALIFTGLLSGRPVRHSTEVLRVQEVPQALVPRKKTLQF